MSTPEHFTEERIAELCDMATVTDWLEQAWIDLGRGEAATTLRVRASAGGIMGSAMAASWPRHRVAGGKLYLTHEGEFSFLVALFSPEGGLLGTFDGKGLTAIRTAAATALAIRYLGPNRRLSDSPGNGAASEAAGTPPVKAALFGTGTQARPHVTALAQELNLAELCVWGRDPAKAEQVARWAQDHQIEARATTDPAEAVADAAVVATVTASTTPVFPGAALSPGALVCAVGSTKYDRQEVDATTVQRAGLVVSDSAEGARTEAGDLIHAAAQGAFDWQTLVDLADVVSGKITPPAPGTQTILFESQGVALQDVAMATLTHQQAHPA